MNTIEQLLNCMKILPDGKDIQRKQTAHRMRLVSSFNITPGEHILEVGCGQGDTTVVLAAAIGDTGSVHALDISGRDYGSPFTLGEATDHILHSPLGKRIRFDFKTDVTDSSFQGAYDTAILSHSLFYFGSQAELQAMFQKLRRVAKRLCVAEWDTRPKRCSQLAHAQAILFQANLAANYPNEGNIQTIVSANGVANLLESCGWTITGSSSVDARELDDAAWECAAAQEMAAEVTEPVLLAYAKLLHQTTQLAPIESLDSFILQAK